MLEKLVKNKKLVILFILILFVVIGVFIAILSKNDSKESLESGKPNVSIGTEQDKDAVKENDENEGGLEDKKEVNEKTENKTNASGSWETTEEEKPNSGSTNSNQNNSNKNDGSQEDDNQDDSNEKDNNKDVIEDDKTWGEVF